MDLRPLRCARLHLQAAGIIPPVIPLPFPPAVITPQPVGGITKYGVQRRDLFIRDGICAAEGRARNAAEHSKVCSDSAIADIGQIRDLIEQARNAAPLAIEDGDLSASQWQRIDKELAKAERKLNPEKLQHLTPATQALRRACDAATTE